MAYRDVDGDGNYVAWGDSAPDIVPVAFGTDAVTGTGCIPGDFSVLQFRQRNGTGGVTPASHADWFDAVAVTQTVVVPEPTTCVMFLGGLSVFLCAWGLSRRRGGRPGLSPASSEQPVS